MEQSGADPVADAIAEMTVIYERVTARLQTLNPRESLTEVTRLRDELERLRMRATQLRATEVDRIRVAENLSLSRLAAELDLTKSRVDHLVRQAQGRHVPGPVRGKRKDTRGPGNPDASPAREHRLD